MPDELFDPDGGVRVLGVGELLFAAGRKGIAPAPPIDIARTIEEVLSVAPLDFVHVHEPWAPSAGSVALRHSRALNVGSFHAPAERVLSTQVARKFVELFFGRMDARTASYEATADVLKRFFPASYELLPPGVTAEPRVDEARRRADADRVRRPRGARRAAALPARAAAAPGGPAVGGGGLLEDRRRPDAALQPASPRADRRRRGPGVQRRRHRGRGLARPGDRARRAGACARRRGGPARRPRPDL